LWLTAGPLGKLLCVSTSTEDDGEVLKREFNSYLGRLFVALSERREQDEMNILDSRWWYIVQIDNLTTQSHSYIGITFKIALGDLIGIRLRVRPPTAYTYARNGSFWNFAFCNLTLVYITRKTISCSGDQNCYHLKRVIGYCAVQNGVVHWIVQFIWLHSSENVSVSKNYQEFGVLRCHDGSNVFCSLH